VTIVERDALSGFARGLEHSRQLESSTRARLDWARTQLHGSGNQLRTEMSSLRAALAHQLGDRLLLTPSCLIPAPRLDENQGAIAELELNARALRLPMTLSYLGCPGATVPTWQFGRSSGILISAPADHDDYILTALPDIAAAFPSERSPRVRPQVASLTP
jgi:Asp-tRNA(Asn)/Glu-tRNA(Gln) amidotransferase A subunit family amidase